MTVSTAGARPGRPTESGGRSGCGQASADLGRDGHPPAGGLQLGPAEPQLAAARPWLSKRNTQTSPWSMTSETSAVDFCRTDPAEVHPPAAPELTSMSRA